eukprot:COSAG01_NODE_48_length_31904_cov_21.696997_28_plen_197_part_00
MDSHALTMSTKGGLSCQSCAQQSLMSWRICSPAAADLSSCEPGRSPRATIKGICCGRSPGRARCVSILLDKNRRHIGKSQSKRPPERTQRGASQRSNGVEEGGGWAGAACMCARPSLGCRGSSDRRIMSIATILYILYIGVARTHRAASPTAEHRSRAPASTCRTCPVTSFRRSDLKNVGKSQPTQDSSRHTYVTE